MDHAIINVVAAPTTSNDLFMLSSAPFRCSLLLRANSTPLVRQSLRARLDTSTSLLQTALVLDAQPPRLVAFQVSTPVAGAVVARLLVHRSTAERGGLAFGRVGVDASV